MNVLYQINTRILSQPLNERFLKVQNCLSTKDNQFNDLKKDIAELRKDSFLLD